MTPKIKEDEYADVVVAYVKTTSLEAVARMYNTDRGVIKRVLKKCGVQIKSSNKKIKDEKYKRIAELYNAGFPEEFIAKMYGVSGSAIRYVLDKCSVVKRKAGGHKIFSEKEEIEMANLYRNGSTLKDIEKAFNTSDTTIMACLDRQGVERRKRKYNLDEHYFDAVDSKEKAYILGLLYSDGYNDVRRGSISITLQEEDRDLLERINVELKNDCPLRFVPNNKQNENWKNCYQLSMCSKYMSRRLSELGCVQRKSLVLDFPYWLDEKFYSSFILGYFDGDGHISKKKNRYVMSIIGTKNFIMAVAKILEAIGVNIHMYKSSSNNDITYTLMTTTKNDSKNFADYIYNDACLYMTRKFNIYKEKYCN